jgi:HSP20 family molecular chaperone IbpA
MSVLLPRFQEFSPFFRLADEIDRATRAHTHGPNLRSFAPRFDVNESKEAYELYGELPGVEQSNINIEWSDDKTLTISGRTEKHNKSGNVSDVTEVNEEDKAEGNSNYQKPTVEEAGEVTAKSTETAVAPSTLSKPVAKHSSDKPRYWITERSVGSFNRTFQFPTHVDHDGVKANLKDGILHLVVPKAKAREPRKVNIE